VARDVDNRHRGMVCGFSEEVQQELGILAIPFKQRAYGLSGASMMAHMRLFFCKSAWPS
jgi:hypothetical protein